MAVYKIPQDVEADDKFVGPLSFKQFIYIGIATVCSYLSFLSLTKGFWPALIFFFPFIVMGGFLGFPWGRDQPTEIWLAARIRFFIKPRVRIWNQSGVKELVTITAPKKIERLYTNGLSSNEVTSRLSGLATLLDSRGWAVKNMSGEAYSSPLSGQSDGDDRLLGMAAVPQQVTENIAGADILDESSNTTALNFDQMIKSSEEKHHQDILSKLQAVRDQPTQQAQPAQQQAADFWYLQNQAGSAGGNTPQVAQQQATSQTQAQQGADFWFLQQGANGAFQQPQPTVATTALPTPLEPAYTTFQSPAVVSPYAQQAPSPQPVQAAAPSLDEEALLQKIHKQQSESSQQYGHLKTIQPLTMQTEGSGQPVPLNTVPAAPITPPQNAPAVSVTAPVNPAIINLANNDDLNIATLARQANKNQDLSNDGEVVISLH